MKWVRTSDTGRRPNVNESVMIYSKEGGIAEGYMNSEGGWMQYRNGARVNATHWKSKGVTPDEENNRMIWRWLRDLLYDYFGIGDSYAYNLTRVKSAFDVGTMTLEDFEEFTEDDVNELTDFLEEHGVI